MIATIANAKPAISTALEILYFMLNPLKPLNNCPGACSWTVYANASNGTKATHKEQIKAMTAVICEIIQAKVEGALNSTFLLRTACPRMMMKDSSAIIATYTESGMKDCATSEIVNATARAA